MQTTRRVLIATTSNIPQVSSNQISAHLKPQARLFTLTSLAGRYLPTTGKGTKLNARGLTATQSRPTTCLSRAATAGIGNYQSLGAASQCRGFAVTRRSQEDLGFAAGHSESLSNPQHKEFIAGTSSSASSENEEEAKPDQFLRLPSKHLDDKACNNITVALDSELQYGQVGQHHAKPVEEVDIFAHDSTTLLVKKYFVYKLMGSELFINHSLAMTRLCYKMLGVLPTNFCINNSVGSLFTSGETLSSLVADIQQFRDKNIRCISNYAVEGMPTFDEEKIVDFYEKTFLTIDSQDDGIHEGHVALKLTGLIDTQTMTSLSQAQDVYLYEILSLSEMRATGHSLTFARFQENLLTKGIELTDEEQLQLFQFLQSPDGDALSLSKIEAYARGHLFILDPQTYLTRRSATQPTVDMTQVTSALNKIRLALGVSANELQIFEKFAERTNNVGRYAAEHNCLLYVDAEQTFMQSAIESFGQQMTHELNVGEHHTVMNGYQNYLKRMQYVMPDEVECARHLGYNLGIKLIRGAYMTEERTLAAEQGVESPVWDSIEDTHATYNTNMQHIISNLNQNELLLLGCHNVDSIKLAQDSLSEQGINDNRVRFAQLKGFSDQITNKLALSDHKVYKFLPYGPTEVVMPYLIRRGQESRQVLREQEFQNVMLRNEVLKRLSPF